MEYVYTVLVLLCIYFVLAASFNVLVGTAGLFSFAHAAFYAVGAYAAGLFSAAWPALWPLAFLVAPVAGCVVGAALGAACLRLREEYLLVATLGFHLLFIEILLNTPDLTGGAMGLRGIPAPTIGGLRLSSPAAYLLVIAVPLTVLCLAALWNMQQSALGRALRAARDDEVAAAAMGKPVVRLRVLALAVTAGFAALAGAVYVHFTRFTDPYAFNFDIDIALFAMVLVGGLGNFWGGLLGAVVMLLVPEGLKLLNPGAPWHAPVVQIGFGALIFGFVLLRPQGLIPEFAARRRAGRLALPTGRPAVVTSHRAGAPRGLAVADVVKSFGGLKAVLGATFRAEPGRITGLIGPNGAGKTTLFNLINGMLKPDSGEVHLGSDRLTGLPPHRVARKGVARLFQNLRLFSQMSALENVMAALPPGRSESIVGAVLLPLHRAGEQRDAQRALECLELVGLADRADSKVSELSHGQQKRVALARAVASEAQVYLLDELASGVAPAVLDQLKGVLDDLRAAGRTVLLIEHNFQFVRALADHVIFLDRGTVIAQGRADDLAADAGLTSIYFGGGIQGLGGAKP